MEMLREQQLVDTDGLVLAVRVHGANLPDREGEGLARRGEVESAAAGVGVSGRGVRGRV